MKTLAKLTILAAFFTVSLTTRAGSVSGHFSSNGSSVTPYYRSNPGSFGGVSGYSGSSHNYVYRNPYSASPSVGVDGYLRSNGTYVAPHLRTAPNSTVTDNLNYRGNGTV